MFYDLVDKSNEILGKNNKLHLNYMQFDCCGLSTYIFNKSLPENALMLDKYHRHELNFIPYVNYPLGEPTYGLIYDYFNNKFTTSVYDGDGDVSAYDNFLTPFINNLYWSSPTGHFF